MARKERKTKSRGAAGMHRREGEEFLTKNRVKQDVTETESGLQYTIIEEGEGNRPDINSCVVIHQRALLLNGSVLEDTYRVNTPEEVEIREMIDGLQEGLLLMKKGSRYRFWVPSELAWGRKGTSGKIPPYAVLFFDIRLLEIK